MSCKTPVFHALMDSCVSGIALGTAAGARPAAALLNLSVVERDGPPLGLDLSLLRCLGSCCRLSTHMVKLGRQQNSALTTQRSILTLSSCLLSRGQCCCFSL